MLPVGGHGLRCRQSAFDRLEALGNKGLCGFAEAAGRGHGDPLGWADQR